MNANNSIKHNTDSKKNKNNNQTSTKTPTITTPKTTTKNMDQTTIQDNTTNICTNKCTNKYKYENKQVNKYVFLDIDGVLNSNYYFEQKSQNTKNAKNNNNTDTNIITNINTDTSQIDKYDDIDPIRVKRLRNIIEETGAKIILCSSWRSLSDIQEHPQWKYLISSLAAENLQIYDQTPETLQGRPYDIRKYLDLHTEITRYIILDDDYGYAAYRKLGIYNLIQTSYWEKPGGLQDYDVNVAISLLNNENATYI